MPSIGPSAYLATDEAVRFAEMRQACGRNVDRVQVSQRIDQREADSTAHMGFVLNRERLFVADDDAVPPLHDVEHRSDDRRVVAESKDSRREWKDRMHRREPSVLASHIVRSRWNRAERRPPDDQLSRAKTNVISEIRVTAGELRDLHPLTKIEPGNVRRPQVFAQPRLESCPIEFFTGAYGSGVGCIHRSLARDWSCRA